MTEKLIAVPYEEWRKSLDNYAEILKRLDAIEIHLGQLRWDDGLELRPEIK